MFVSGAVEDLIGRKVEGGRRERIIYSSGIVELLSGEELAGEPEKNVWF